MGFYMHMQIRNVKVTSQMNSEISFYKIEETRGAKQIILLDKAKTRQAINKNVTGSGKPGD